MPVTRSRDPKVHPELSAYPPLRKRIWDSLFHPTIRLPVEIPWDMKKFSRVYAVAAIVYLAGSIIPLLLIFAFSSIAIKLWPENAVDTILDSTGETSAQYMLLVTVVSF